MQKTMYKATHSLAVHICRSGGKSFEEIWNPWLREYDPPESMRKDLEETCRRLIGIGKEYILRVPEKDYRRTVTRSLKPTINKEDMYGAQEESM